MSGYDSKNYIYIEEALKQKVFHEHFCLDDHNGIQDWVITLIEQVDDEKFLRQRELFWAHKLAGNTGKKS